jgi:hypothetical protein
LTKDELLERLNARAKRRYGIEFTETILNDLIKDRLIQRSNRLANRGKHPTHGWDRNAYRRGLQLARFKASGIERRNTQRVFLFLRGYSYQVQLVRGPICAEYVFFSKKLLSVLRSRYLNHKQTIPPGQKDRLVRSFGEIDAVFAKAGIKLEPDFLISLIRSAAQDPLESSRVFSRDILQKPNFQSHAMTAALSKLFSGMLLLDEDDPEKFDQELDSIEGLLQNGPESAYIRAREMFSALDLKHPLIAAILFPNSSSADFGAAADKAVRAIKYDPLFSTTIFVLLLRFAVWEITARNNTGFSRH